MAPSWLQNGVKIGPKTVSEARSAPGPILWRCWVDFGTHFGRFWDDFGTVLGGFWFDFGLVLVVFFDCQPCKTNFAYLLLTYYLLNLRSAFLLLTYYLLITYLSCGGTERAKRAECVLNAYLLLTYYLLITYLNCEICVFSDTCLVLAWYTLSTLLIC